MIQHHLHPHHRRLCCLRLRPLILALAACLSLCPAPRLHAQQPGAAAAVENPRAEILRKAASSQPGERISAAEAMADHDMDYDLFWKLMNDPDSEVRLGTLFALAPFLDIPHDAIPLETVRKWTTLLDQHLTHERINAVFGSMDSRREEEAAVDLLYASALCLDRLYQTAPLPENRQSYSAWQDNVLKYLVISLAHERDDNGGEHGQILYEILSLITDPDVLRLALQHTLERLDDIPSERQLTALERLSTHPLLGPGKPLHLILLQELSPTWVPVRDHILRTLRHEARRKDATVLLSRIDEAYAQLRKQLAPPTAQEAQK